MAVKKCSECGGLVGSTAKTCPHCGAKGPAQKRAEQAEVATVIGCGVVLLLVLGPCIMTKSTCTESGRAAAEKRSQEEGAKAKKRREEEAANAEKWKQQEANQPERKELIEKSISLGWFRKVQFWQGGATIWVDSSFYLLDFEIKEAAVSVVYAYVATNAKDDDVSVVLQDALSGNTVGDFGHQWSGFGLKMK